MTDPGEPRGDTFRDRTRMRGVAGAEVVAVVLDAWLESGIGSRSAELGS